MSIILHPEAVKNINQKVDNLVGLVREVERPDQKQEDKSDLYISAKLTDKDIIGEVEMSLENGFGQELGKYFRFKDKDCGLIEDGYIEYEKTVHTIYKIKSVSEKLSLEFLKKCLFRWIKNTYINGKTQEFIDHLLQSSEDVILDYDIIIPIPYTLTSVSFKLGNIEFITITEKIINEWFQQAYKPDDDTGHNAKIDSLKESIQKQFQGYAAGVYKCQAEIIRAQEIAFFHLSNSLGVLRLFSPANHFHELISAAYEYGQKMTRSKEYFSIRKNDNAVTYSSGILDKGFRWMVDRMAIGMLKEGSTSNYNKILCIENPNEFQEKLLEAIIIYSKHTLRYELFDKILYILVALESMLLKNGTEPIQQNVGERMAFLVGKDASQRKDIVCTLRDIYNVRSKFIHHGESFLAETDLLRKFMNYSWLCFSYLVAAIDKFKTKEELVNYLDTLKFS